MNLVNNIKNFLYDQSYFISIYEEYVHIFAYSKIEKFSDTVLIFKFDKFKLLVKGEKLLIKKMLVNEALVKGIIKSITFEYE